MTKPDFNFLRGWYPDIANLDDATLQEHLLNQSSHPKKFHTFAEMAQELGLDEKAIPDDFDWEKYKKLNENLPQKSNQWQIMLHYLRNEAQEQNNNQTIENFENPPRTSLDIALEPEDRIMAKAEDFDKSQEITNPDFVTTHEDSRVSTDIQMFETVVNEFDSTAKNGTTDDTPQALGVRPDRAQREAISIIVDLDEEWYSSAYNLPESVEPQAHYHNIGAKNLLAPNLEFSPVSYWQLNPDVARDFMEPITHYTRHGYDEKRRFNCPTPAQERNRRIHQPEAIDRARDFFKFDSQYYLSNRPDLDSTKIDPWEHYYHYGEFEGACPSPFFDGRYYRKAYANELSGWPLSALEHFLAIGLIVGFFPSEEVATAAKRMKLQSAIEWVGHWLKNTDMRALPLNTGSSDTRIAAASALHMNRATHAKRRVLNWVIP